jgi:taspase (threonine aspartase 1)
MSPGVDIKNPISLARMVLDNSTKPMSLNRVPPNLLVGAGATDFAYENGMPILHADFLIAKGSKERWLRWRHDLNQLEDSDNQVLGECMDVEYQNSVRSAPWSSPGAAG